MMGNFSSVPCISNGITLNRLVFGCFLLEIYRILFGTSELEMIKLSSFCRCLKFTFLWLRKLSRWGATGFWGWGKRWLFTLHSDQSFLSTPELHGSRIGIHPVEKRKIVRTELAVTFQEIFYLNEVTIFEFLRAYCVISDLSLDHSRPLCPEHLHRLEDINHTFITHSFQDDAEGDEDSGPSHSSTTHTNEQIDIRYVTHTCIKHIFCKF